MPRPMLRTPQGQTQTQNSSLLSTTGPVTGQQSQQMDKKKLDQLLRKNRSKEYMEAMRKLDAGGHVHNQNQVNEIINTIRAEFPEVELRGILLGFVAICMLEGHEVHTLDLTGGIIEHFKPGQMLPNGMEKARNIAMRGGYEYIEVYVDCCRAISANGSVAVIPC